MPVTGSGTVSPWTGCAADLSSKIEPASTASADPSPDASESCSRVSNSDSDPLEVPLAVPPLTSRSKVRFSSAAVGMVGTGGAVLLPPTPPINRNDLGTRMGLGSVLSIVPEAAGK